MHTADSEPPAAEPGAPPGDADGGRREGDVPAERGPQSALTWGDGTHYVGEWVRGWRHGRGSCAWPDGATYAGQWANGVPHGPGRFAFADGGEYEGEVVEGLRHGRGRMRYPSGAVYEGGFDAGEKHGAGTWRSCDDEARADMYIGQFHLGTAQVPAQTRTARASPPTLGPRARAAQALMHAQATAAQARAQGLLPKRLGRPARAQAIQGKWGQGHDCTHALQAPRPLKASARRREAAFKSHAGLTMVAAAAK